MDEALEALELVAESELEGVVVWLLRALGAVAVVAGLGLWLFTDAGLLVLPALLLVVGVVLVVAPSVLLALAELA
jgi:predicted membrane metal-binding protein